MGQSQENNNGTKITEKKKRETSAEKKAMISEDVALGDIASDKIFEADPELAKELEEDRKIQARALEYKEKKLQRAQKRKKSDYLRSDGRTVRFCLRHGAELRKCSKHGIV